MPSFVTANYNSLTQTFRISTPDGVPGVFVSKLTLYFRTKSESLGVQVYLTKCTNGLPDNNKVIPHSLVTLDSEDINVSDDATAATEFVFNQLLFLNTDEKFAFVVKPIGNSPDYNIWVGELGKRDISSDKPIGGNPLVEKAYFSGAGDRWSDLINQDVKFLLHRAKFKHNSGTVSLRNKNTEILKIYNISLVTGRSDIRAGDEVYAWANDYVNTQVSGVVTKIDLVNDLVYLKDSTGNFQSNTDIAFIRTGVEGDATGESSGLLGIARLDETDGIYDFPIHAIAPKLGIKKVPFTDITLNYIGTISSGARYVQDAAPIPVLNNYETEFRDRTRYYLGESKERDGTVSDLLTGSPSTNTSVTLTATLTTESNYISPVIDLNENNVLLLRNLINSNTSNEHLSTGAASSKYVSKIVTLEDGMEAEDLKVYVNASKPPDTDIKVYAKIWDESDPQPFDLKVWSLMTQENSTVSSTNQPEQFNEYVFKFNNSVELAGNAFAAYETSNSTTTFINYYNANTTGGTSGGPQFISIKKFAIKLVLTANEGKEYLYPRVNDLRVIALQM